MTPLEIAIEAYFQAYRKGTRKQEQEALARMEYELSESRRRRAQAAE